MSDEPIQLYAAARIEELEAALAELAGAARDAVREAKSACGRFNPHIDCSDYLQRDRICPDCPYEYVADLALILVDLDLETKKGDHPPDPKCHIQKVKKR